LFVTIGALILSTLAGTSIPAAVAGGYPGNTRGT